MPFFVHGDVVVWLVLLAWGGSLGGVYTTALTMLGRAFQTDQLSAANAAASMAFEIGAMSGPLLAGLGMRLWDPNGLLGVVGLAGAGLVCAGLFPTGTVRRA